MASKIAEAYVEIATKQSGLDSGLAASESKLQGFLGRANSLLGSIGMGLAAAGVANFVRDLADAGGDMIETMNKVNVVFGNSAGTIFTMADDMATNLGAVKVTTLDAAAGIGLMGQAAGMSAGESAKFAESMVRLADDASSFFNVPLDTALAKIRSGIAGEALPLREFGVLLSEAAVKAQALAMGFLPVNGAFTEQEKVMARVALITAGLAKVQGDHANTMDSYSNAVKRLSGDWENFKAETGTGIAAGAALTYKAIKEKPGEVFKSIFSLGELGNLDMQGAADKMFGVKGMEGIGTGAGTDEAMKRAADEMGIWASRMASMGADNERRRAFGSQEFQANRFYGGGFGAFGMFGNMGQEINRQAMVGGLDQQIADQRARMNEWSGGHVTDPLSFLKSAQEKILQKPDETAQKQLDELVKIREAVSKGVKPGAVAKGPEH
jgi:hypothetical protein